jgi:Flp pilus assembly protein TadG
MKKILRFKRNTDGQSLVEFALILPILISLILGMIEFGWILNGQITLTSAAREGARVAIVYESAADASTAVQSAVSKSAESSSLTIEETSTTFNDLTKSAKVTVNAKIQPIIGLFFSSDVSLTAKAEMRIE